MLKIFKEHVSKTSILEDFTFYENRQKLMQEKRVKQQQVQKQVWDSRAPNPVAGEKQQDTVNGKPSLPSPNGVTGDKQPDLANGKPKTSVPNGVNGKPSLPSPNGVTGEKQPDLANGKPKTSVPNGVNGDVKVPVEKPVAPPAVTYAAKVAQKPATEKPVLANGAAKTVVA